MCEILPTESVVFKDQSLDICRIHSYCHVYHHTLELPQDRPILSSTTQTMTKPQAI
jgi:hypothetical protein